MKYILRLFGLFRVKDINKYLDDEIKYWADKRKNLTNVDDILYENTVNQFEHYETCVKQIKCDMYLLNRIV